MSTVAAGDVWGVGHRTEKGLAAMGIKTALALAEMDIRLARRLYGVTLERTIRELRGEACFATEGRNRRETAACCIPFVWSTGHATGADAAGGD